MVYLSSLGIEIIQLWFWMGFSAGELRLINVVHGVDDSGLNRWKSWEHLPGIDTIPNGINRPGHWLKTIADSWRYIMEYC